MRTLIFVLVALAQVPAGEAAAFRLEYDGGRIGLGEGLENELVGGVRAWYEQVHLSARRLAWTQSQYPGLQRPLIDSLSLEPDKDGLVTIDSRESVLAAIGFRGLLLPERVHVTRYAVDQVPAGEARWRVVLDHVGWFAGDLESSGQWIPHAGWADTVQIDLGIRIAEPDPRPRCISIHLLNDPANQARRCRLDRLREALPTAAALADHSPTASDFAVESRTITIHFDADGRFETLEPGVNTTMYGKPPGDLTLRARSAVSQVEEPPR